MNKTKYLFIVALAVSSLVLWGSRSYAQSQYNSLFGSMDQGYGHSAAAGEDRFQASWLIGHHVSDPTDNSNLGQISDLLIDRCSGRVAFVVLSDTPNLGAEHIAVPFESLFRTDEQTFQLTFGAAGVPIASNFESSSVDFPNRYSQYLADNRSTIGVKANQATFDSSWADGVYKVYGLSPYWTEGKTSQPGMESYVANITNGDPMIGYPGGRIISSGATPYWASCGSCGGTVDFEALAQPALPSFAKSGECYARVFIPARCETVSEQVMTRAASERVETIPAKYEVVEERVMVKPASKRIEEVPAEYKMVDEKVLVEPAHTEWREGRGSVEKMDAATGKIMCLVEVPATYKTVQKQVLLKEATTREVEIPAQYEMQKVNKMVEPAHENRIQIPAEYKTVTRTEKVADGYLEWQKVEGCHTD